MKLTLLEIYALIDISYKNSVPDKISYKIFNRLNDLGLITSTSRIAASITNSGLEYLDKLKSIPV